MARGGYIEVQKSHYSFLGQPKGFVVYSLENALFFGPLNF